MLCLNHREGLNDNAAAGDPSFRSRYAQQRGLALESVQSAPVIVVPPQLDGTPHPRFLGRPTLADGTGLSRRSASFWICFD